MKRRLADSITAASLSEPLTIPCAETIKEAADRILALDLRAHAALQLRVTRVRTHCEAVIGGTVKTRKQFYDERLRILDEVNRPGEINARIIEIVNDCFRALGGAPRHRSVQLFEQARAGTPEAPVIDERSVKRIGMNEDGTTAEFAFEDGAVRDAWQWMEVYAPTDTAVLIQAETGSGKDLLARAIHELSRRKDKPFYKLNIATLSPTLMESELFGHEKGAFTSADRQKKGAFEAAGDGTLFIDELGEMPVELQAKLLTVLEGGGYYRVGDREKLLFPKSRVVAATNLDVERAIKAGRFRLDLFHRLGVRLQLPPLRQRTDLDFLIRYFQAKAERAVSIDDQALDILRRYDFPGNVRELRQIIANAATAAAHFGTAVTPAIVNRLLCREAEPLREAAAQDPEAAARAEAAAILRLLNEYPHKRGFQKAIAARLGMSRNSLANRIGKYGIKWDGVAGHWTMAVGAGTET